MKWAIIENMVTVVSTAALVLGLYAMGAGGWAGWGVILLVNLNTKYSETTSETLTPAHREDTP